MFRKLVNLIDGRMAGLEPHERGRFFTYSYMTTRSSRTMLTFGMPLLFLIGWMRDYAVLPEDADTMFARRSLLFATLVLLAQLVRMRSIGLWREAAWAAYACVFGSGIVMTTLAEPVRLSLSHVAAMLMIIILLPFALYRLAMVAVIVAFFLPLFLMLAVLGAPPMLWVAYLLFGLVGIGIGLGHRRTYLDASLDVFQLRTRLLARLHADSLTGALNREGWQARAGRLFDHAAREGKRVSLAYFDLDHFKSINDTHGHAAGDAILECTSAIMLEQTRPDELIARLGGEEFVTLLPDTDEDRAFRYADRIRLAVEAMEGAVPVTLSGGVAERRPGETLDALVARADAAMLEAKRRGRNLVLRAGHLDPGLTVRPAADK